MNALIYDIEIEKAIADKKNPPVGGIEYCKGWGDHAGMGISFIGAYDYQEDRYRAFFKDNFADFANLVSSRNPIVGFNNIGFDNKVLVNTSSTASYLYACHIDTESIILRSYDILREIWRAAGLDPNKFNLHTHVGYGLDDCCKANFGIRKSGNGALAPVDFQRGKYGNVADYCLNDVRMTKKLFDQIISHGYIIDPKDQNRILRLRRPGE